jgi:hypothetical protein
MVGDRPILTHHDDIDLSRDANEPGHHAKLALAGGLGALFRVDLVRLSRMEQLTALVSGPETSDGARLRAIELVMKLNNVGQEKLAMNLAQQNERWVALRDDDEHPCIRSVMAGGILKDVAASSDLGQIDDYDGLGVINNVMDYVGSEYDHEGWMERPSSAAYATVTAVHQQTAIPPRDAN